MSDNCPNCDHKIDHEQKICEICGVEIKWIPKYKKGKFFNPFWDDMLVIEGTPPKERPKTRTW